VNANITATTTRVGIDENQASGIGTARLDGGLSHVGRVTLGRGTYTANGFAGIGSTEGGTVANIEVVPGVGVVTITCGPSAAPCINGTSVVFRPGRVVALTTGGSFVDPKVASRVQYDHVEFDGQYRIDSDPGDLAGAVKLHFPELSRNLTHGVYTIEFKQGAYSRKVLYDSRNVGLIATFTNAGVYEISYVNEAGQSGQLKTAKGSPEFRAEAGSGKGVYVFTDEPATSSGLTGGAIAGIVISVVIIICAIVFAVMLIRKLRGQKAEPGTAILDSETQSYSAP
jgi:hypothetical protein